jgi:GR25 family glycosyltransferase involved in LPS biosynthesis
VSLLVYVISLERAVDRRDFINRELYKKGLEYRIIDAIDAQKQHDGWILEQIESTRRH